MAPITKYPEFSKIDLSHRQPVNEFTASFEPYSDFNFTSLFCWNTDGQTELSDLNGNLVIKLPDYLTGDPVFSILGRSELGKSVSQLLETAKELKLVPAPVVGELRALDGLSIEEDRDSFDYIYELSELSRLSGMKFKKKRNKTNSFVRAHEDYELVVEGHNTISPAYADKLRELDRKWASDASRNQGDIMSERRALDILLKNAAHFKLLVVEITVDGDMKAFSINEDIGGGYAMCHFEKALKVHHENIYTFLASETAEKVQALGCKYVNWEQDLGLEGLRKSKISFHPSRMLKKYTVQLAG